MLPIKIFDLDGTVINSHHRTEHAHVDGKFCLNTYLTKCNQPEQVARDALLPLAAYMQDLIAQGEQVAIITARYMEAPDLAFLGANGLCSSNTLLYGRDSVSKEVRALPDALYKVHQLNRLKSRYGVNQQFIMFDDIESILKRLSLEANIVMINAVTINSEIEYSQQVNTCELTKSQVIEAHVSSIEFRNFCTNQMIA